MFNKKKRDFKTIVFILLIFFVPFSFLQLIPSPFNDLTNNRRITNTSSQKRYFPSFSSSRSNTVIWSDDFGDSNYNGWTVETGTFSASNNLLRATGEKSDSHRIKHPSNVSYGTWSFDVSIDTSTFISMEHMYLYFLMETLGSLGEEAGYFLVLWLDPPAGIIFGKRIGMPSTTLGEYNYPNSLSNRQHIDITRDITGHFNIFVNGSLIIEAMDTEFKTSNYFGFDTPGGHALDNITVNDEVVLQPKSDERASLRFLEDSLDLDCEQGRSSTTSFTVKNEGKASGYVLLATGSVPAGISPFFIGPDNFSLNDGSEKEVTVGVQTADSVKPGNYVLSIELHNSSQVFDTLPLNLTVLEIQTSTTTEDTSPGISILGLIFGFSIVVGLFRKNKKA